MRTTRTLAMITAGLVAAGSLSACGGGPDALDAGGAKEVLLSSEKFPLDGFTQGEVKNEVDQDATMETGDLKKSFEQLGELDEGCKKALDSLGEVKASDYMDSQASADYTKDKQSVALMVGGTKKDGQEILDRFKKVGAECDELSKEEQGMKVTVNFEEVKKDDFEGATISMDVMGQKQDITMGGKTVGENLIMAMGQGISADDAAKVVGEQAKAVEDK